MGFVYLAEAAGARILRYGVGVTQVGDPYQLDVQTWDARPFGEAGVALFRTVVVSLRHTNGYSIDVTPFVDGVQLPAKDFSSGAPPSPQTEEVALLRYYIGRRGTAISVRVKTLSLLGETEIVNIGYTPVLIRVSA